VIRERKGGKNKKRKDEKARRQASYFSDIM